MRRDERVTDQGPVKKQQPDVSHRGGGGRWVSRSVSVGAPKYIPQNDPHDTLLILNIHKPQGLPRDFPQLSGRCRQTKTRNPPPPLLSPPASASPSLDLHRGTRGTR